MTLSKDTLCQGGCGKIRSVLCADSPADWICNDCRKTRKTGRSKAAKARKLSESVSYRVYIIGWAWGGFQGTYSYTFSHEPTQKEIEHGAGDFQSVDDYEIVRLRCIHYSDGERRIVKTIRPWANQDSVDIYCDANGC